MHVLIGKLSQSGLQTSAKPQRMGIGDAIHRALKPMVKGTRLAHCRGCQRRRTRLNRWDFAVRRWLDKVIHRRTD